MIDYSYDELSRLIQADYNKGANVYNYGYDVAGNMVDYDGVTCSYNAANQMTNDGTNTLTYDNNGNLTDNGTDTYTWDRANRLSSIGNHSYVYDGLSNRVQQTVNTVVTDYLNDVQPGLTKLLKQDDGTNVDRFVHAPRGIHAVDDGTDWNFYAQDGLGSVRALVDDASVVQSAMAYDPYGNPMASYGAGFGFTGEQTDVNGAVFLRARYYEPSLGVFNALDPFEGISCTPMSLNGYGYVHGNVINMVDPSGAIATGINMASAGAAYNQMLEAVKRGFTITNPFAVKSFNSGFCDGSKTPRSKNGGGTIYSSGGFDDLPSIDCDNPYLPPDIREARCGLGGTTTTPPITFATSTPVPSPTVDPNRELTTREKAYVLAITGETGPQFVDNDRAVIVFVLQNRLTFPNSYEIPERSVGTSQVAPLILNGFDGSTRQETVENAYEFFSVTGSSNSEIQERFESADAFVRQGVGTDFTGGALHFSHTDTPEVARQIVERIEGCGESFISNIIRSAGVDPIINGNQMVVGSTNISVYINMNYSLPFTLANAPNCS